MIENAKEAPAPTVGEVIEDLNNLRFSVNMHFIASALSGTVGRAIRMLEDQRKQIASYESMWKQRVAFAQYTPEEFKGGDDARGPVVPGTRGRQGRCGRHPQGSPYPTDLLGVGGETKCCTGT